MIKIATVVPLGMLEQEKNVQDVEVSTCSAFKTTCQPIGPVELLCTLV